MIAIDISSLLLETCLYSSALSDLDLALELEFHCLMHNKMAASKEL
jgi:hypothetical protein